MNLNFDEKNKDIIIIALGIAILYILTCTKNENFSPGKENSKQNRKDNQSQHERNMQSGKQGQKQNNKLPIAVIGFTAGSMICCFILMMAGMMFAAKTQS
jgi:hypothetical protein